MKLPLVISLLVFSSLEPVVAQNAYVRLGKQAFVDGDFRMAVRQLEKACLLDSTNANSFWMLGYSYYHSDNYAKSITAFNKELSITPTDAYAYYWRAQAKSRIGRDIQMSAADREKYMLDAIFDYTKAIEINSTDGKVSSCYQNRGLTYRDYALFKLDATQRASYDKMRGIRALRASIEDLSKVLADNSSRNDISTLLDQVKEKLASVSSVATSQRH